MSTTPTENKGDSPMANGRKCWCTRLLVGTYIGLSWVAPLIVLWWYHRNGLSVPNLGKVFSWWSFCELLAAGLLAIFLFAELPVHMRDNRAVFPVFGIIILVFAFLFRLSHLLIGSGLICVIAALFVLFDIWIYKKAVSAAARHKLGGYALCYIDVPILLANVFLFAYFWALQSAGSTLDIINPSLVAFRDGAIAFEMLAGNLGVILLRYHPEITDSYFGPFKMLKEVAREIW